MAAAPLHFLVGSTGAGKTTYAREFCARTGAVRFSVDEWMDALFWMDSPRPLQPQWSLERVDRCSARIWRTAVDVAAAGLPCMLELGFARRAARRTFSDLARAAGLPVQLHVLDVPAGERWARVQLRNLEAGSGGQLSFPVTRDLFDFTEAFWEPPTPEERAEFTVVEARSSLPG